MKMTPVLPCSTSNVALIPGNFISGKNNCLTRCSFRGNSSKALYTHSFLLPLSITAGLFPKYLKWSSVQRRSKIHILAATETDLVVEEPGSAVAGENAEGSLEVPTSSVQTSEAPSSSADADVTPTPETKTPKTVGKSNAPRLKIEELVTGATFTGKVRSVQPFGAFVDFGAFTDGLVHISNLSDTFVKDIGSVVSVGQEVTVRILEVNPETKRIALTMRSESNQRGDPGYSDDNPRPSRRNSQKQNVGMKSSKFVTGQELSGTVKNIIRAGCFISLPEGEEGFLPLQEEGEGGFRDMMGSSALQVGQEVTVRVLNMNRGKLTLTTKKENAHLDDPKLMDGVVVHTATNPFLLAFRKNKDIATFLDAREDMQKVAESPNVPKVVEEIVEEIEGPNEVKSVVEEIEGPTEVKSEATEVLDQPTSTNTYQVGDLSVVEVLEDDIASEEVKKETEAVADKLDASVTEFVNDEENLLNAVASSPQIANATNESVQEKELSSKASSLDETVSSVNLGVTSSVKEDVNISAPDMGVGGDQISSSENVVSEKVVEIQSKSVLKDELQEPQNEVLSSIEKDEKVEDEKNGSILVSSADVPAPQEAAAQATSISAALVKQLREETGAGMMDCKKALAETGGDLLQAQEFLRKKGLASADKKASRVTAEGRIGSYIHDSRIGVLLEVNCETDFVSRGDIFKELVDDLAMQVAACPQVQYIVTDDVPVEMVNKERDIEMQKEDLLSKPEQIRSKIVEGQIRKRLEDLSLLEQPYIKNDKMVVKDWVKQTIATIGENIKVKRFVRFNLGEGLEKKSQDFAAEVAAQTAAKPSSAAPKTQAAAVEAVDTAEKPPTVTISAALVKQLREETGAGMMDCKKALKESDGSIEKAQEYLRKKGLSAADKKSSRIAAEGRVGCYIHDYRIGVLIEVNCETDFVGRSEKFKEMVDDLAMQVAACPQVQYVSVEDIPESFVSKEKELEMQREDLQSKPENIREKIVEGRIAKRLGELALLEQPFIKDDTVLVKDLIKQTVVALGENIKVRRFVRFTLGEAADSLKEASEA